jgi:5-methyltetrahydropteroyltriglutamate--homocysteine methyltransferase
VPLLRAELEGLVAAGAGHIQIDDPSPAIHPDAPSDFAALFNAAVEPVVGRARLGAHLCFGNYLGKPLARRRYRPVLDAMLRFRVDELVLEFVNREMAEIDLLADLTGAGRDVAAGIIDVKNSYLETADDVAERIDQIMATGIPAERLALVPDCGFSQTPRAFAIAKLRSLVAGRDLVLGHDPALVRSSPDDH